MIIFKCIDCGLVVAYLRVCIDGYRLDFDWETQTHICYVDQIKYYFFYLIFFALGFKSS